MKYHTDPVLSRIQSHVESLLRESGKLDPGRNVADQIAENPEMIALDRVIEGLRRKGSFAKPRYSTRLVAEAVQPQQDNLQSALKAEPVATCVELYTKMALAHLYGDEKSKKKIRQRYKFSTCDIGWIEAIEEYYTHFVNGRAHIPYRNYTALEQFVVDGLPGDLRIGILGDWGTGQTIATDVLDKLLQKQPDIIIHLGDVYYSGTVQEYEHKFVNILQQKARKRDSPIPIYNMTGNHDMYAGGKAYYDTIKDMHDKGWTRQEASYFCLRLKNSSWQLLAADTSFHDHDPFTVGTGLTYICREEVEWHRHKVDNFSGQTVFLSHHQPFSAFEQLGSLSRKRPTDFFVNPRLLSSYRQLDADGKVALWLWGHEHNLAIYERFAGIERGRCIGHSAVPVLCGSTDLYEIRRISWKSWLHALHGLFRGKWGARVDKEIARLLDLQFRPARVPTPTLVEVDGVPVKLAPIGDRNGGDNAAHGKDDMYRHGYTVLSFATDGAGSNLTADYYDDVADVPIWSEHIRHDGT